MNTSNKKTQFVWAQTVTVYGSKLTLHTTNFKKSWGLKFYEAFRYGKSLNFQALNSKLPAFIKLFIGCELLSWVYSKFIKERSFQSKLLTTSDSNKNTLNTLNERISNNFIYKFFEKENHSDYISNIITYYLFGKYYYCYDKRLTYFIFLIGGLFSVVFYKINDKAKLFSERELRIEDLSLYSTQFNLIPKILLTSSILFLSNFFFKENFYLIKNKIPMNHKLIYIYFWCYIFSKISRPISHFTHDCLNLRNVEGASAWLISALLVRPTMFPCFIFLHYFNPYSFIVWVGAKNNTEDKWVEENYSKKSIIGKLKTYFLFISMLSITNMLDFYF